MAQDVVGLLTKMISADSPDAARSLGADVLGAVAVATREERDAAEDYLDQHALDRSDVWVRRLISRIWIALIAAREPVANPLSLGIVHVWQSIKQASEGAGFTAMIVQVIVATVVEVMLVLLWPLGLFVVAEEALRRMIMTASVQARCETETPLAKAPHMITIGLFGILWSVVGLLSLPLIAIGWIGHEILGTQTARLRRSRPPEGRK